MEMDVYWGLFFGSIPVEGKSIGQREKSSCYFILIQGYADPTKNPGARISL